MRASILLTTALAVLALLLPPARSHAGPNLHAESARCLREEGLANLSVACRKVCVMCHPADRPVQAMDIYQEGDQELCLRCHAGKTARSANNMLPEWVPGGGGNHPTGIAYDPWTSRTGLKQNPQGPRLFYDDHGDHPRLHCSTCHDPMGDAPKLLRMSNRGSALCLACHRI